MNKFLTLDVRDVIKGLSVSIISAVLTVILDILQKGSVIDWKAVGIIALTTGISYLLKNVLSDENGKIAGKI